MISCRRPWNTSSRLTPPLGPSNSYFFSTASHGIRRRSAARASRARVKSFSFTRSCCRAASHSCGDTIGGVFISLSFVLFGRHEIDVALGMAATGVTIVTGFRRWAVAVVTDDLSDEVALDLVRGT